MALCDHPGFGDTRGVQYEICTNLSMDRAIEVCNSLRAIVLVVSYDTITERGSNQKFMSMIDSLNEKFPALFDSSS